MAQNITIAGASYSDVPAVTLPKTGGGTAKFVDLTGDTVSASSLLQGFTAHDASGNPITGTAGDGTAEGTVYQDSDGYLVLAEGSGLSYQTKSKSYTPSESQQTESVTADSGYDGLATVNVTVGAISSSYVGSGITQRSSSDLTASGATVTVPAGYYSAQASKAVSSGAVSASATKGSVSNHAISVTPTATVGTAGYLAAGSTNGTAVSVSASELVSGTYTVDSSGTKDVTNYASASVPALTLPSSYDVSASFRNVASVSQSTSAAKYINIPTGFNDTAGTYTIPKLDLETLEATENGTYYPQDEVGFSSVKVNVSGGSGSDVAEAITDTELESQSSTLVFEDLLGEPTSFVILYDDDMATPSGTPYKALMLVYDGTTVHGQTLTNTNNAQVTYDGSNFSKSYSNGTLTITSTGARFPAGVWAMSYTYGGTAGNIGTADVQVGSGATSITFTGLEDEPLCWSCIFKSNFSTSSGYQRVIGVRYSDTADNTVGFAMDSAAHLSITYWTSSYSNGSLTISSQGTNAGGYFHQPGYYQLTYAYGSGGGGGSDPVYQSKTVSPSTSQQVVTADSGYAALSQVTVNAMPTGTAGTPTASKGSVSNHAVTVTPSVTNTTGYITGGTKTGTGVSVSASELVSGNRSITSNGTNIDVTNYATVSVNVGSGSPTLQAKTNISPSTSSQTITADSGYDGLSSVQINAMPTGTAGNPTATKGSVSNHQVTVTPSVTNTTGYITGGTKTGTGVTVTASELASGNKSITSNGTNIDVVGYSTVSVSVSGGASNFVQGTFTTSTTTGAAQTVSIPYTGSGYPIFACVEVTGGYYNSSNTSWYSLTQRYAVGRVVMSKTNPSSTPDYEDDTDYQTNGGNITMRYKSSSSSSTQYSDSSVNGGLVYTQMSALASNSLVLRFSSSTQMSVFVASSSYGLKSGISYTYYIVYSS